MLLLDIVLETVNIIDNQPETIIVKEKTEAATAYVVDKTMPSNVHNAYGYLFDGCAPQDDEITLSDTDVKIIS